MMFFKMSIYARSGRLGRLGRLGLQEMVAKSVTGHSVFSRALLAPGDVGTGTHSARGRHSTCAMAPKPMEYEITDGRRCDETLAQQPSRDVKLSEDASLP